MVPPLRIGIWQARSPAGDIDAACAEAESALAAASAIAADLVVLPELFLPGYNVETPEGLAVESPPIARLRRAAARHGVALVFGFAEFADDKLWNAALCLGPDGDIAARYRKIQLYGPREKHLFAAGSEYAVFDLRGQRFGLLICYDVEFAPHVARMAELGVTALLVPTANMQPFTHVAEVTVPAMAANHGLAIAYANYCGQERDLAYVGTSTIVGPHGEVLARAGNTPCLLVVDLPDRDHARLSTQAADLRRI